MADVNSTALVTDLRSGDGPHPAEYPRWEPKYDRMMNSAYDTPEHRSYFKRMRELWERDPMAHYPRGPVT